MKLIVGLGNPGKSYKQTRHNIGSLVLDFLAEQMEVKFKNKRSFESLVAEGTLGEERVVLLKPQTFMNVSGRAVCAVMKNKPIEPKDVLVVYDDADLPFADVRIKTGGSSAGHKGVQSIMDSLGASAEFFRVRVGIGRPNHPDIQLEDFVLQPWTKQEEEKLDSVITSAITEIKNWL